MSRVRISVVVIGLNEERRLGDCLESVFASRLEPEMELEVIYVDSGSTDQSVEIAKRFDAVTVVRLDDPHPNAAKGRNAGIRRATGELVQLLDGDSILHPKWLTTAVKGISSDPRIACVFGRCEELEPRRNVYTRVCSLDWHIPAGDYRLCGGNALWRREALAKAGGFDVSLSAGEEPDLSYRVRKLGHRIVCLDAPMVTHDLDMRNFRDYWSRAVRSGVAYATIGMRFRREPEKLWFRETVRNLLEPALWILAISFSLAFAPILGLSLIAFLFVSRTLQIAWTVRRRTASPGDALLYALHQQFIRLPLALGELRAIVVPDSPAARRTVASS